MRAQSDISKTMDISRAEQRILHLLAQGGRIEIERGETRKIERVTCINREGWRAPGLDIILFRKLKRRRAIVPSTHLFLRTPRRPPLF